MFHGSIVALVTPMKKDESVDYSALAALIDWHVEQGTDAIVAMGTTGESATLDEPAHCDVVRAIIDMASGRIPVIAGTGANSTVEAISLTRCAADAGADACLLVTPYYNKPTQEGLFRHYKAVAEAVSVPQILYNVPSRTACDLLPDTVARLAPIENIIGIKEATGDLARAQEIRALTGPDFAIYAGDDATACELMLQGGQGVISVTSNVAPKPMAAMCRAALDGDKDAAEQIDNKLASLHEFLFIESNPIPVKWALWKMGKIDEGIRLPLTWLSERARDPVLNAMKSAGLN